MRIIVATTPKILIEQLNNFVKMNNLLFFDFYNQILLDSINMEYFVSSEVQFNIKMVNSDFKIDNDKNYVLDFEENTISVQQVKNNQIDHINITVFTWNPRESIWAKNIGIKLKKYIASIYNKGMKLPQHSKWESSERLKRELKGYYWDDSILSGKYTFFTWLGDIEIEPIISK